jgi:hypothetical protein
MQEHHEHTAILPVRYAPEEQESLRYPELFCR